MSKQIKIGFDKGPSRSFSSDQVLVDVGGIILRDSLNQPLYTKTDSVPVSFFEAKNALSVHVNNEDTDTVRQGGSLAVVEQFPETSEVSSSLLGVPRSERQQTLLADVSIYGQDENTWEFYRNPTIFQPAEWANRVNKTYGNRFNARLKEYPTEQALALEMFPTPFSFPFGEAWSGQGRYNETLFGLYKEFIRLGNNLFQRYSPDNIPNNSPRRNELISFGQSRFLDPEIASVDESGDVFYNNDDNDNFRKAFEAIERWTTTWMDIVAPEVLVRDPNGVEITNTFIQQQFYSSAPNWNLNDNTRPGYFSDTYRYCQLESKESFRYQPGAVSGFTFGVKLNANPSDLNNFLEWGCANDTDQLMFQVRGSQFNIVRRSTVQLGERNLSLNGLSLDAEKQVQAPNPFERGDSSVTTTDLGLPPENKPPLYELVIRSDDFNGDPLNGSGRSGYTITFNEVTMYKIEYSWYGAVGAKFYAYVPVSNDEARWVLIHTLIIENTLSKPSLQNPFMKFRYCIYTDNTRTIREPLYLYKYGASYYIDGSDKGTFAYKSYKISSERSITSNNSVPLVGFFPKDKILNKDGIGTKNQKNFYIDSISVFSDKDARVDFLECEGCPGGHGHFYASSLQNGQRGQTTNFIINDGGNLIYDPDLAGSEIFTEIDNDSKIIGPGIFSSYAFYDSANMMNIRRRLGGTENRINNEVGNSNYTGSDRIRDSNNQSVSAIGYKFQGRLSGYRDIIASENPLRKPNIKVQFLNPIATESSGQWAEFRIGITSKRPSINDGQLVFGVSEEALNLSDEVFAEFAQFQPRKDVDGVEIGEWDTRYGSALEQDPRISRPLGASSGICSEVNFKIEDFLIGNVSYTDTAPIGSELQGSNFLVFTNNPGITQVNGGGIGLFDGNRFLDSGIRFTSNIVEYEIDEESFFAASIDITPSGAQQTSLESNGIALKRISCFGRYINVSRAVPFESSEYYLFIAMRDNARINNIVVQEFDNTSSFSSIPKWIKGDDCLINEVAIQNPVPPSSLEQLPNSREYIGLDGKFYMGGITGISGASNPPASFTATSRLDSVLFDQQLSLPLRPSSKKTSIFVSGNKSEIFSMNHIFDIDRFKLTTGSFNNKYLHISSIVTEEQTTGRMQISVSGREQ
jgi:hypothetical protein